MPLIPNIAILMLPPSSSLTIARETDCKPMAPLSTPIETDPFISASIYERARARQLGIVYLCVVPGSSRAVIAAAVAVGGDYIPEAVARAGP